MEKPSMSVPSRYAHICNQKRVFGLIIIIIIFSLIVIVPTSAQDEGKAQIIDGYLALGEKHLYMLPGLKQGDTLSIYVEGIMLRSKKVATRWLPYLSSRTNTY
jgi:hypothetical protein